MDMKRTEGNILVCQEKQGKQATLPESSLFITPHLDSALGGHHSKGCSSHYGAQHKNTAPQAGASKEQQGQTIYFYFIFPFQVFTAESATARPYLFIQWHAMIWIPLHGIQQKYGYTIFYFVITLPRAAMHFIVTTQNYRQFSIVKSDSSWLMSASPSFCEICWDI